ncbi:hypothetical protein GGI07_001381 [Coemansia sp. Benny D115]|nr:hypothetical protein GGI07_001381 [Coemansia sp. Benny D115]
MAYARPLGHTFNQLNLSMYRLPDSQRGALRSTSLALAREASREDSVGSHHRFSDGSGSGSGSHNLNPIKGIKRLYSGLRRHRKSRTAGGGTGLRKFYSTPQGVSDSLPPDDLLSVGPKAYSSKTAQTTSTRRTSDSDYVDEATRSCGEASPSPPRSPTRACKRVRFSSSEPDVTSTYSPEEYDRRVVDPWELLTKDSRVKMRQEMHDYTTKEMKINKVYSTNDSQYCTLCWRLHCHCRVLAKDIWRRDKSTSMVRAGA